MAKEYNPKYYAQPVKGTGHAWLNPKNNKEVICRGIEWYLDFQNHDGRRQRKKTHVGLCQCPPRKTGKCIHEKSAYDQLASLQYNELAIKPSATSNDQSILGGHNLSAYIENYLNELKGSREHSPSYVTGCSKSLGEFKQFCVQEDISYVESVDRKLIRSYRSYTQQVKKPNGQLRKTATINRYLREVGSLLSRAVQDGLLVKNPSSFISRTDRIILPVKDEKPLTILTDAEVSVILNLKPEDIDHLFKKNTQNFCDMLRIFCQSGIRRGELINLTYAQIRNNQIHIEPHHNWKPKWGISRVIPMRDDIRSIIMRRKEDDPHAEYVFTTSKGTPFEAGNLGRDFSKLFKALNIVGDTSDGVSIHSLRRTFCTTCLDRNIPPTTVKAWMGHSRLEMTMRYFKKIPSKTDSMINSINFGTEI